VSFAAAAAARAAQDGKHSLTLHRSGLDNVGAQKGTNRRDTQRRPAAGWRCTATTAGRAAPGSAARAGGGHLRGAVPAGEQHDRDDGRAAGGGRLPQAAGAVHARRAAAALPRTLPWRPTRRAQVAHAAGHRHSPRRARPRCALAVPWRGTPGGAGVRSGDAARPRQIRGRQPERDVLARRRVRERETVGVPPQGRRRVRVPARPGAAPRPAQRVRRRPPRCAPSQGMGGGQCKAFEVAPRLDPAWGAQVHQALRRCTRVQGLSEGTYEVATTILRTLDDAHAWKESQWRAGGGGTDRWLDKSWPAQNTK